MQRYIPVLPRWQDALDAAEATIKMGYDLCPNYEELFMQDNSENDNARKEFIFAIAYDRDNSQSWGGTTHLVSASLSSEANSAIAKELGYPGARVARENWNGYHVPNEYVEFFELKGVTWGGTSGFGYDRANSDNVLSSIISVVRKNIVTVILIQVGDVGSLQAVIQKEICSLVMNSLNFHLQIFPLFV